MRIKAVRARAVLSALALLALLLACGLGGDRPAWANYKIVDVSTDEDGERVEVVYYCISAPRVDTVFHCKQPKGKVEKIEILEGHSVQIWALSVLVP